MIETLVAITILTLAVTAPLSLAGQGLIAANYAKDQVIAFNLAQEAVEVVRYQRDNKLIDIGRGGAGDWLAYIKDSSTNASLVQEGGAASPIPFRVNTTDAGMYACSGTCPALFFDSTSGFYGTSVGTASRFTRTVYVTRRGTTAPDNSEATVRAVVTWQSGGYGTLRRVEVVDEIYQWVPSQN
jgi:type II secretory pathway pseudopilin PulG